MKSIKDKADEKYPIITGELQTYNEKFVEGANYALDAIEGVLSHPRRFVSADISISEAMITEITKIIEQLKNR